MRTWWRWYVRRWVEAAQVAAANAMPRWLAYRCYIRVGAEVSTRPRFRAVAVGDIRMMDALQEWDR
jgi:hypothetical protein